MFIIVSTRKSMKHAKITGNTQIWDIISYELFNDAIKQKIILEISNSYYLEKTLSFQVPHSTPVAV